MERKEYEVQEIFHHLIKIKNNLQIQLHKNISLTYNIPNQIKK